MGLQFSPAFWGLIVSAIISVFIFLFVYDRKFATGRPEFMALMLSCAIWSFAYAMELGAVNIAVKKIWFAIEAIGFVTAPVHLFLFALRYTGKKIFKNNLHLLWLYVLPVIIYLFIVTNRYHYLYIQQIQLGFNGNWWDLYFTFGPIFWIQIIYSYILIFLASYYFLQAYRQGAYLHQRQAFALFLTGLVPLVASLPTVFGINPYNLELAPFGFSVTGLIIISGLFHYRLLDVLPVARGAIVEKMDDMVLVFGPFDRLIDYNASAADMFNLERSHIGLHYSNVFSKWPQFIACLNENRLTDFTVECRIESHNTHFFDVNVSKIMNQANELSAYALVMHDITHRHHESEMLYVSQNELKKIVQVRTSELNELLQEKEVLIKEVHHRVKNNMQIISSMLGLQANMIKEPETLAIFEDSRNRIKSMALVHESLYKSENLAQIRIDEYVNTLSQTLLNSYYYHSGRIQFDIQIPEIYMDIDYAVPCGLLINELLTNAIKHAFPDDKSGTISLVLEKHGEIFTLNVADDGVGIPSSVDVANPQTIGLQIVGSLGKQLQARVDYNVENGTSFTFQFNV